MNVLRILVRLILSYVAAELGTYALSYLIFGPGIAHTLYVIIPLVLLFVIAFWALGYIPGLAIKPKVPMQARTRCSKCGGEIALDTDTCPHCGLQFGAMTS